MVKVNVRQGAKNQVIKLYLKVLSIAFPIIFMDSMANRKCLAAVVGSLMLYVSSTQVIASDIPKPDNPLADTEWRLVEFQSMDDAQGTIRPEDPSLYTMHLNRDGTVNMRLNCNRANGTWIARREPSTSGRRLRWRQAR